jgi:putative spermidine/putrescine transport system substrate-binding protein
MTGIWKRYLLGTAVAVGTFSFAVGASAQRAELIVSGFGGAYDETVKESAKSFEAEHNIKVTVVPSAGADNLAKVRNKEIDIMISDPVFALRLEAENVFAKLDPKLVPNLQHLYKQAVYSDYTVSANLGAYIIAYSPERLKEAPTSWYDLGKPEFAGRVVLRGFRPENIDLITMFAKRAGGDERRPDAGFAEMAKIAKNVHSWTNTHAEILQLYRNGEVDLGTWTDGRVAWAKNEEKVNVSAAVPKEGFFPLSSTMSIVAGRPNGELAQKFLNHLLGVDAGTRMAARLGYFPTNSTIQLPPEVASKLVLNKDNIGALQTSDWKYIVSVYDEWQRRWEKEIVR